MLEIDSIETCLPKEGETIEDVINRKLDELLRACLDNNVTFFATVAIEHDGKTDYINRAVAPVELGLKLSNDRITKYTASLNENFVLKIKKNEQNTVEGDTIASIIEEDY